MQNKSILILCASDPQNDPRPNRMISWLKDNYQVTVVGSKKVSIEGVESIGLFGMDRKTRLTGFSLIKNILYPLLFRMGLSEKLLEEAVWSKLGQGKKILEELSKRKFDLVIPHECVLLPFAFEIKRKAGSKILMDLREFYARDFEDLPLWRFFKKPVFEYLCRAYLKECDKMTTVSQGLAQAYRKEYDVETPEVMMSLPQSYALTPVKAIENRVRMVYHGIANASRRTEVMVKLMDHLGLGYSLDLMLVPTSDKMYRRKLERMVHARKNVRIIPPVPMREIVPFINQYDIGLFLCPPSNLNLEFTLPNKFFEYIQARLAVAIGPNVEMKKIVEKYECGVVAGDFEPHSLAGELRKLSAGQIMKLKYNSHHACAELNAAVNRERMARIVQEMLS